MKNIIKWTIALVVVFMIGVGYYNVVEYSKATDEQKVQQRTEDYQVGVLDGIKLSKECKGLPFGEMMKKIIEKRIQFEESVK